MATEKTHGSAFFMNRKSDRTPFVDAAGAVVNLEKQRELLRICSYASRTLESILGYSSHLHQLCCMNRLKPVNLCSLSQDTNPSWFDTYQYLVAARIQLFTRLRRCDSSSYELKLFFCWLNVIIVIVFIEEVCGPSVQIVKLPWRYNILV